MHTENVLVHVSCIASMSRITIIQGHPDPMRNHLCHAIAGAYMRGVKTGGHTFRTIAIAELDFALIKNGTDFIEGQRPHDIQKAQSSIRWADHLVIVFPLWLGTMPALMKGFLEQVFRYDFAFEPQSHGIFKKLLKGKSAHVFVTMGMPSIAYRFFYRAHSVKNLERNILNFSGIHPVRNTYFGGVENATEEKRRKWLRQVERLGEQAL